MELLPFCLFFESVLCTYLTYATWTSAEGARFANPALSEEEANNPSIIVMQTFCFALHTICRFHACIDVHSKSAYRVALWSFMLEVAYFVVFAHVVRGWDLATTFSGDMIPPFAVCLVQIVWMTAQYRYYLYTSVAAKKKNK